MRALLALVIFYSLCNLQETTPTENEQLSTQARSITEMNNLLRHKALYLSHFKEYLSELRMKLKLIKKGLKQMNVRLKKYKKHPDTSIFNEFSKFSFSRHLHMDWRRWLQYMKLNPGAEQIKKIMNSRVYLPTKNEFNGTMGCLLRMMETYNLKPADVAVGLLDGKQSDASLNSLDCFALGLYAYKEGYIWYAKVLMELSIEINQPNRMQGKLHTVLGLTPKNIYQLLADTFKRMNMNSHAWSALGKALKVAPDDKTLYSQRKIMQTQIFTRNPVYEPLFPKEHKYYFSYFMAGCRGEFKQTSNLRCHYDINTHAFLRLAPFKVEVLHLDPYIVLCHDFISDLEIEALKALAIPRLKSSIALAHYTVKQNHYYERFSQSAKLETNLCLVTKKVNQRIQLMTGLELKGSPNLQVVNYGLGGHFYPHYDFMTKGEFIGNDRIASFLIYLSDVTQGGATAFTKIDVAIFPKKGSALFWYNLDHKLDYIPTTMHGGCSVLFGSKWIATKWILSLDQTFIKPCKLTKIESSKVVQCSDKNFKESAELIKS